MPRSAFELRCVLFDLDGTLLDTGPDLANAVNIVRDETELAPIDYQHIRPYVSHGSIALTRLGCPAPEGSAAFEQFRQRLLDVYRDNIAVETRLFAGMDAVLERLEAGGIPWGIVTNKPSWLTDPLVAQVGLSSRASCVISGDTTEYAKPHPMPLLEAAARSHTLPQHCAYIGDAERDIQAGREARMFTIAAAFGYLAVSDEPESWSADLIVADTVALHDWCDSHLSPI